MRVGTISKLLEAFESHLSLISQIARWAVVAGGGIVTAWAAFISELWVDYAPFSYVVAFFIGAFLAVAIFAAYSLLKYFLAKSNYVSQLKEPKSTINPIDNFFTKKRIHVADLASPISTEFIVGKTFADCELIGPAVIGFFNNCTVASNTFTACDFVKLKQGASIHNLLGFENCTLTKCKIYKSTIYVPENLVNQFPGNINWITK